jgi:hypothetical protein
MKRFLIGSLATMMMALPVFANTSTTTTTEETQKMEESTMPNSDSATDSSTTTIHETQKMEESVPASGDVQRQDSMDESTTTPSLDTGSSDEVKE